LPLIEDSEKVDLKSAKATYEHLKNEIFPARNISLLHGRMPAEEKEKIMRDFHNKDIQLLVSTTVIEVGVDIPNASIMVVHHAERFGLSQLHQLRGRVGRGAHQSFCVLIYPDDLPEESKTRINILTSTDDGFAIAEEDLKIRGAGEFTGTRQHGYVSSFEFADVVNDFDLITMARQEASLHVAKAGDLHLALESVRSDQNYATILDGLRTKHILAILS
ncbi:MAG TPA: helicase-related protein, partial [Spirochaetota bacterium]|nr:helicase-related protein [Spirochaetota bacterium]